MDVNARTIDVGGLRTRVLEAGDSSLSGDLSSRAPVVMIHGAGFDRTVWRLQTRWFAHHGRSVLAIDFPAHGWSEGPAAVT